MGAGDWVKTAQMPFRKKFLKPDVEELRSLRREVSELKAERNMLKNSAAYFARKYLLCSGSWRCTEGFGQ